MVGANYSVNNPQKLIQKYNHYKSQPSKQIFVDTHMLKKYSYCERGHEIKKEKIPTIWENLFK